MGAVRLVLVSCEYDGAASDTRQAISIHMADPVFEVNGIRLLANHTLVLYFLDNTTYDHNYLP